LENRKNVTPGEFILFFLFQENNKISVSQKNVVPGADTELQIDLEIVSK